MRLRPQLTSFCYVLLVGLLRRCNGLQVVTLAVLAWLHVTSNTFACGSRQSHAGHETHFRDAQVTGNADAAAQYLLDQSAAMMQSLWKINVVDIENTLEVSPAASRFLLPLCWSLCTVSTKVAACRPGLFRSCPAADAHTPAAATCTRYSTCHTLTSAAAQPKSVVLYGGRLQPQA
jgi:hypothetical protein